jgi:hypothetical protein
MRTRPGRGATLLRSTAEPPGEGPTVAFEPTFQHLVIG